MNEETIWAAGVWIFAALWTVGIGWVADSWIVMIWALLGFIIASAAVLWVRSNERKKHKLQEQLWREESLAFIHRRRHDWLNDLQLIYGYVRLNKYDKLPSFVESLKSRLQDESSFSVLGSSHLEWELLRLCTFGGNLKVDVSVDPEWNAEQWLIQDVVTARILRDWLDIVSHEIVHALPIEVHINFIQRDEEAIVLIDQRGSFDDVDLNDLVRRFSHTWPEISVNPQIHTAGFHLELSAREK